MVFNLQKRKISGKDYSWHKTLGVAPLPFANSLILSSNILNQENLPACSAYASVATRWNETNGTVLDPLAFWDVMCSFAQTDGSAGFDLEVPAAAAVESGFPSLNPSAYLWITPNNGQDLFDSCRTAIKQSNYPLVGGVCWMEEWTGAPGGIINNVGVNRAGGHALKIAGWTTLDGIEYMVLQNSWGTSYGNGGLYYMTRDVFNNGFAPYGVFIWSDNQNVRYKTIGLLIALYQNVITLLQHP
jgi:hypothetical protein